MQRLHDGIASCFQRGSVYIEDWKASSDPRVYTGFISGKLSNSAQTKISNMRMPLINNLYRSLEKLSLAKKNYLSLCQFIVLLFFLEKESKLYRLVNC